MPWPIPGSFSNSLREAVFMFRPEAGWLLDIPGLKFVAEASERDGIKQAEVETIAAMMRRTNDIDTTFAGGRSCFTYASKCS